MHLGRNKHRKKREEEEKEEEQKHLSFYTVKKKKKQKKIFGINFSKMSMKHKNGPEPGIQGSWFSCYCLQHHTKLVESVILKGLILLHNSLLDMMAAFTSSSTLQNTLCLKNFYYSVHDVIIHILG